MGEDPIQQLPHLLVAEATEGLAELQLLAQCSGLHRAELTIGGDRCEGNGGKGVGG